MDTLSFVPTGLKRLDGARNPSDKSLGYYHTVPLGLETIAIERKVVDAINCQGRGWERRLPPLFQGGLKGIIDTE